MADRDTKKYYWLKLDKDFFKKHEIRIVKDLPNGKDYIIFYLTLLCEATSHEGYLRFSETIPYNEEMLASLTQTNIDIVRSAIKIFTELEMMQILDDGTIYLAQVQEMIGCETGSAIRKREYREQQKWDKLGTNVGQCPLDIRDKRLENRNKNIKEKISKKEKTDFLDQIQDKLGRVLTPYETNMILKLEYKEIEILEALNKAIEKNVNKPIEYASAILHDPKKIEEEKIETKSKWLEEFKNGLR